MNFKPTKHRISTHLEYDWYKYLLIIAAALFCVIFPFGRIGADRKEETFTLFVSSYASQSNEYSARVMQGFSSESYDASRYGAPIMRSVSLNFQSPLFSEYGTLLATQGMQTSDALIVGKNYLYNEQTANFRSMSGIMPIDESALDDMGVSTGYELLRLDENFEQVHSGGKVYAIRIDTLKNINKLAVFTYEDNESEFYLMLLDSGGNVGLSNKGSNPSNRQAFFCLKVFFELYGN